MAQTLSSLVCVAPSKPLCIFERISKLKGNSHTALTFFNAVRYR